MRLTRVLVLHLCFLFISVNSWAMVTPHPTQQFERGMKALSEYHGDERSLAQARDIFSKLITGSPDSPLGYVGMSRIGIIRANLYEEHYDIVLLKEEALPFAVKAIELGPSLRIVHENYAIFEKIFSAYNAQRKTLQQTLIDSPDSPQTYISLAELLRDQQEYDKAIEYYKVAFGLNPDEALKSKILKQIAMVYFQGLHSPQLALEYFKKASALCPDCSDLKEYIGRSYLEMGQYTSAVEELGRARSFVETSFNDYYLLQAQGYLSEEQGDLLKAVWFLEKATSFSYQDMKLSFTLGNLYYKLSKYEDAYGQFRKVIELNPEDPGAYYFAGRSADHLGKSEVAADLFKKYLQLRTDTPEAEWIRRNIPDLSHK